jgi:hypothetical protein
MVLSFSWPHPFKAESYRHFSLNKVSAKKYRIPLPNKRRIENFKCTFTLTFMFFERGTGLQRMGKVLSVTPSSSLIIKTESPPKIGCEVVDEGLNVVGKVFDVIGPVSSPMR